MERNRRLAPVLRAALFDLDGTLLDTLQDLSDSMNTALAFQGLPAVSPSDYRLLVGTGASELSRLASRMSLVATGVGTVEAEARSKELAPIVLKDFRDAYGSFWANATRPYDGVPEALSRLRRENVALAVLSNKPDPFTKRLVSHFFPDIQFACVRGELAGEPRKPDPESAREILATLGIPPREIAYFGDSGIDMQFAVASGFIAVGVLWGFRSRAELSGAGADELLTDPSEIPGVLGFPLEE
jgi:phosphoglycolate phosphatase